MVKDIINPPLDGYTVSTLKVELNKLELSGYGECVIKFLDEKKLKSIINAKNKIEKDSTLYLSDVRICDQCGNHGDMCHCHTVYFKYEIKFICSDLTGDKIHTMIVTDDNLVDIWDVVDVGHVEDNKIIENARKLFGNSHDVNVYLDETTNHIIVNIYTMFPDEDGDPKTDHEDWYSCKVLRVKNLTNEYDKYVQHDDGYIYPQLME